MNKLVRLLHGALILSGLALFSGCGNHDDIPVAKEPEIVGLATPVQLQPDSTTIELSDYFRHPKSIDSVSTGNLFRIGLSADSLRMTLIPEEKNFPRISVMTVWIDGFAYSLLLEKSRKIWHRISFDPKDKKFRAVSIAGEMNDWVAGKSPLRLKDGIWQTDLLLFPGRYQYKLVVDGKWILDPGNPESVDNNVGGFNSVLHAGSVNPSGAPYLFTDKTDGKSITIGVKNKTKEIIAFWQNYRLDDRFLKNDSNGLTITVPLKAKDADRSFLRVWAWNAAGSSNEILVPLSEGKVITDPALLTRQDKEAMIIYFMMVDRFRNGNRENDQPVKDPELDPKVNYFGGDLAGIKQKIDSGYFKALGVNTIWISPVTLNPPDAWREYPAPHRKYSGYHGYWPVTLTTVDPRFGTSEEMKEMIKSAHNNKMNVLLDFVSNHVHESSALYKQHPDWATQLDLPGGKKNIRLWNDYRLTTWFDTFLPTLDLSKPEVYSLMSDSALFWIKQYELDGFRHDACKHVPEIYWRELTRKLRDQVVLEEERPVYQIGESFGSRELISSYLGPGLLDAQFDFGVYFDARTVFSKENASFRDLNSSLQESFNFYGEHSLMGNITGNQDLARFITYASNAMSYTDDDHEFGWKNDVQVKDSVGYARLGMLMAFNMTIPGIPVIYYGDEYGMPGANDPDNRRMMQFGNLKPQENRMKAVTEQLTRLRSSNLALTYGDFRTLEVSEKVYIYMRSYFDKVVFVVFNKDKNEKKIDFEIPARFENAKLTNRFGSDAKLEKTKVTLTLKGNSFEILTN